MSQDPLTEDREFSPWVRKKTARVIDMHHQEEESHKFLAKINISPKMKKQRLLDNGGRSLEVTSQWQDVRADL